MEKDKQYLVVGLGLLGGKYALELSRLGYKVWGINRSQKNLQWALDNGYIQKGATENFEDLITGADRIIFGLYPTALLEWLDQYGRYIQPGTLVTDVSGVKSGLVDLVQAMMPQGAEFIGSHPMAGKEVSGVQNAAKVNFGKANFIITPTPANTPQAIAWLEEMARELGFACISRLTPKQHDEMIGYVSQLCHAIAASLMCANDDPSLMHYCGDSFRDLTRIANLNAPMWAELFVWNKDALSSEIDDFITSLRQIQAYMQAGDRKGLEHMFEVSTQRRQAMEKK